MKKEGIFLGKNSRGFYISIKQNQHKLAVLTSYNTRANAMKGLLALNRMLNDHYDKVESKYVNIIDLTKPVKKAIAPKSKVIALATHPFSIIIDTPKKMTKKAAKKVAKKK